ncbi:MAG: hypothetical protein ABIG37_02485 [Nanoarchaeota archaeon]|nr:hypothetical protein [Nanoarchaeota archaeon]
MKTRNFQKLKMHHPTRVLTLNNKSKILKSKLSPKEVALIRAFLIK